MTALQGGPSMDQLTFIRSATFGRRSISSAVFKPAFAGGAFRRLISAQARRAVRWSSTCGTQPTTLFLLFWDLCRSFRPRRLLNY